MTEVVLAILSMVSWWVAFSFWWRLGKMKIEMKRVEKMRDQAIEMKEHAAATHLYCRNLLRVARQHEAKARAILVKARKEKD